MKKILLLLLIFFISISTISASENTTDGVMDEANIISDNPIVESVNDSSQNTAISDDNGLGDGPDDVGENNSSQQDISIQGNDLVWYYKANPIYKFIISDSNGTGVCAEKVSVNLNGKISFVNTDENGTGILPINLKAGNYVVKVTYGNVTKSNKISLFSSRISHNRDISTKYGTKVKYLVRLVDNAKKPMANARVTFTIGNKVYTRLTNAKGYAALKLNYNSGKYVIKYKVKGLTGKNRYTVTNKVSFEILKWGLTGDVSKAPLIKKNMPNNRWVKKAVAATKKGLPLITIKGGNGKVVFMTAGVHGNELNSQVAAMKMIKYLTSHPIKGTVYIIPFVNVKAISQKVRLTDYDFNRVAHRAGTVSNKIINLILKKKCDAYGDFHTTVSPGVPGINVVLGYSSPNKCLALTNYIAKNAKVNKIVYYPGQKYTWSLADFCNLKGTPAVICEVISPVNVVSSKATKLSYKEMTSFLNFNKII